MGDLVYLKSTTTLGHLQEKWRGPFKVILTTPTAAKLAGFPSWVHVQNLKLAAPQKNLSISSYRTNKNKDLLPPQDPRRWRHTHGDSQGISKSPMSGDLASRLLTLYTSPLPFFPVSACPCFYSFIYTLHYEVLDFPPPNMVNLPPFSYLFYPCFIDWISNLHLQGTTLRLYS
jgi:hypothetical protein